MSRSLLVSRTILGLSDLELWNPPNSVIEGDSFGPGQQVWRRETATGPYTAGRILIGIVPDVQVAQLRVNVQGSSGSDLDNRIGMLLNAFSQLVYTVTFNFDGSTGAWRCEPADYSVGDAGVMEDINSVFHVAPVLLSIPRSPIPTSGSF